MHDGSGVSLRAFMYESIISCLCISSKCKDFICSSLVSAVKVKRRTRTSDPWCVRGHLWLQSDSRQGLISGQQLWCQNNDSKPQRQRSGSELHGRRSEASWPLWLYLFITRLHRGIHKAMNSDVKEERCREGACRSMPERSLAAGTIHMLNRRILLTDSQIYLLLLSNCRINNLKISLLDQEITSSLLALRVQLKFNILTRTLIL